MVVARGKAQRPLEPVAVLVDFRTLLGMSNGDLGFILFESSWNTLEGNVANDNVNEGFALVVHGGEMLGDEPVVFIDVYSPPSESLTDEMERACAERFKPS